MTARLPFKWHTDVIDKLVDASTIRPHERNPNNGDEDVVRESILTNGVYRPIFVNRKTKRIVGGHTQYHVEVQLQLDAGVETPVVPVSWTDGDAKAALKQLTVDNGAAHKARMDDALLLDILEDFDSLIGSGYDEDDLARLRALDDVDEALHGESLQMPELDGFSRYPSDVVIDSACDYWTDHGFPYRDVPLHEQMMQLNRLAAMPTESLLNSDVGYHVADHYHPHRFSVPIPGKHTPISSFGNEKRLRHAFKMILDEENRITATSLASALGMVRNSQAAANFRPAFALLMYRRFCEEGTTVLDTSTGFGGRLVGFAASRCARYIGIDPNVPTHDGNERMAKTLGFDDRVQLINLPAEDVDPKPLRDSCDFAFTSPPYFSKEQYSDDDTQSWVRYATGSAWREGFLQPMLRLQHAALVRGAYNVVNIADVKIGSDTFPLVEWAQEAGAAAGFEIERVERFPLSRVPGNGEAAQRFEPVVIMRKP